jgi:hypothetical protein
VSRSRDARGDQETECFYCEMPLAAEYEQDHYPVPKVAGGTETVFACFTCHNAKDRIPLGEWPINTALRAVEEISEVYPEWNPWPRSELPPSDLQRLSPGPARVLLAKWVRLWHEGEVREAKEGLVPAITHSPKRTSAFAEWRPHQAIRRPRPATRPGRPRGRKGGRKPKMTPAMVVTARDMIHSKDSSGKPLYTVTEIAETLGVSRATIYDHLALADTVAEAKPA